MRESMAAFQRSSSSVKLDQAAIPILPEGKLKSSPSMVLRDAPPVEAHGAGIRNRNILIGLLSTLLILAVSWQTFAPEAVPAYEATLASSRWSHGGRMMPYKEFVQKSLIGAQKFLVSNPTIDMSYHGGPLLTGTLTVNVIFYGSWTATQQGILTDFIRSFAAPKSSKGYPTLAGWWSVTNNYKDKKHTPVAQNVVLGKVVQDKYSVGKNLMESDVETVVVNSLKTINAKFIDPNAVYIVLTSADVNVQGFCSSQCGTHSYVRSPATQHKVLPFVWVGNPAKTCPGYCAWPFAKAQYGAGPNVPPLKSPNNDVGVDGMCITIASLLASAATNTLDNGWFQGSVYEGYDAVSVCGGIYGTGAYPGFPGNLLTTKAGQSYNINGVNGRKYLVPFIFDLVSKQCVLQ